MLRDLSIRDFNKMCNVGGKVFAIHNENTKSELKEFYDKITYPLQKRRIFMMYDNKNDDGSGGYIYSIFKRDDSYGYLYISKVDFLAYKRESILNDLLNGV